MVNHSLRVISFVGFPTVDSHVLNLRRLCRGPKVRDRTVAHGWPHNVREQRENVIAMQGLGVGVRADLYAILVWDSTSNDEARLSETIRVLFHVCGGEIGCAAVCRNLSCTAEVKNVPRKTIHFRK